MYSANGLIREWFSLLSDAAQNAAENHRRNTACKLSFLIKERNRKNKSALSLSCFRLNGLVSLDHLLSADHRHSRGLHSLDIRIIYLEPLSCFCISWNSGL